LFVTLIDEALIETTCQEVANLDATALSSAMEVLGRSQPNLLAFVMATCEELGPEAAELGVYVFFVVYRAFECIAGGKLKPASQQRVLAAEEQIDALLTTMGEADASFLTRTEESDFSTQPVVVRYIADVLAGYGDEEGESGLSGEEKWLLFYVLTTVVEVLDDLK
jgi:hypothetical protein